MQPPEREPEFGPERRPVPAWLLALLALVLVGVGAYVVARFVWNGGPNPIDVGQLQATETVRPETIATTPVASLTPAPTHTASPTTTPTPTSTSTSTPTPTPTPIVVITGLKSLGRLETAQFAMQTIVDLQATPSSLLERLGGGDQLLLVAEGEVVAGFDLEKVAPGDILVQGQAVTLTLPPPEILYSRIDNEQTYVYERRTGVLRRPDPGLESEARRLAERRLLDWALERGILAQANRFGLVYLEGFLRSLGLTEISINVRPK